VSMSSAKAQFYQCDQKMYVHHDIVILGFPCPKNSNGGVSTQKGVDRIIQAIDLLVAKSPRSLAVIQDLKKTGPVMIIYDPTYPPPGTNLMSQQFALFLPSFAETFDQNTTGKQFTVIVGHAGIQRTLEELASVLVHELMGHGKQHLEDRILAMRVLDVECEAWLREEMAYQDLKMDKLSREMVDFRQQLETLHCSDFIRYMRKRQPDKVALWDVQNPDVPKLLSIFEDYIIAQRERGMISSAQEAILKQREEAIQKVARKDKPEDLYKIGVMYMSAIGQTPDPTSAAIWYQKAAAKGHAGAELALAQLYEAGNGVKQDYAEAIKLYVRAAKQGNSEAFYALGVMFEAGLGVAVDFKKAEALYAKARPGLDTRPLVTFGMMHNEGTGFAKDPIKAQEYFLKAARLGDKAGQFEVGMLLKQGHGVAQDSTLAAAWIQKSAAQGYLPAQRKLEQN